MKTSKFFANSLIFVSAVFSINLALAQQQPSNPSTPGRQNSLISPQDRILQDALEQTKMIKEQTKKEQQTKPAVPPTPSPKK
jgi:hypothetical protein